MICTNHYECALEAYLKDRGIPYLAVCEKRRARTGIPYDPPFKSPDFLLSPPENEAWIAEVKGRRFSSRNGYWKHWTTWDDLIGLRRWESLFGSRFKGLLVFAYEICGSCSPLPEEQLYTYRRRRYGFVAMELERYIPEIHLISIRWNTYAMPTGRFRQLAKPFEEFLFRRKNGGH